MSLITRIGATSTVFFGYGDACILEEGGGGVHVSVVAEYDGFEVSEGRSHVLLPPCVGNRWCEYEEEVNSGRG